eukprot:4852006-Pyramimonas_sp.AAC.1
MCAGAQHGAAAAARCVGEPRHSRPGGEASGVPGEPGGGVGTEERDRRAGDPHAPTERGARQARREDRHRARQLP